MTSVGSRLRVRIVKLISVAPTCGQAGVRTASYLEATRQHPTEGPRAAIDRRKVRIPLPLRPPVFGPPRSLGRVVSTSNTTDRFAKQRDYTDPRIGPIDVDLGRCGPRRYRAAAEQRLVAS